MNNRIAKAFGVSALLAVAAGCASPGDAGPRVAAEPMAGAAGPHPAAPAQLSQFGRFVGLWRCAVEPIGPDGLASAPAGEATWQWSWAMDGFAVQDTWRPDESTQSPLSRGTGIRVFDSQSGVWRVAWTSVSAPQFSLFDAVADNQELVMSGQTGDFDVRMVFFAITDSEFSWRYEVRKRADQTSWSGVARMQCQRSDS